MNTPNTITVDSFHVIKPRAFFWEPKEDITTYELAQAFPFVVLDPEQKYFWANFDRLPDNVKRHFREIH